MSYCIINGSFIKFENHKNCQLYIKFFYKIIKSFKKLGLGTPPLKKREKQKLLFLLQDDNLTNSGPQRERSCGQEVIFFL